MSKNNSSTQQQAPAKNSTGLLGRFQLSNWQIVMIALIVVGGRLIIDFSQRIVEGQQKLAEQAALEEEIAQLEQEHRELLAAKAYYSSPAFVESWAHDEGKMVRDGEILIVPAYTGQTDPAAQANNPQLEEITLPPWQVWWTIFFDNPPPFEQLTQ